MLRDPGNDSLLYRSLSRSNWEEEFEIDDFIFSLTEVLSPLHCFLGSKCPSLPPAATQHTDLHSVQSRLSPVSGDTGQEM